MVGAMIGQPVQIEVVPAVAAANAPLSEVNPLRILLAEDFPDNRNLMSAYLRNHPYTLDAAENGQVSPTNSCLDPTTWC
jgi:response regulator RpfG family c-di-GMP phosphodiesterase